MGQRRSSALKYEIHPAELARCQVGICRHKAIFYVAFRAQRNEIKMTFHSRVETDEKNEQGNASCFKLLSGIN